MLAEISVKILCYLKSSCASCWAALTAVHRADFSKDRGRLFGISVLDKMIWGCSPRSFKIEKKIPSKESGSGTAQVRLAQPSVKLLKLLCATPAKESIPKSLSLDLPDSAQIQPEQSSSTSCCLRGSPVAWENSSDRLFAQPGTNLRRKDHKGQGSPCDVSQILLH